MSSVECQLVASMSFSFFFIQHHPQAAASTEQRRKDRSSSAKTITRALAAERTALAAGGAARLLYKLAILTFKIRHASALAYLSQHIRACSGTRSLRSSSVPLLDVPFRRTSIGKRSFSCAAPATWNSLPPAVVNCDTLSVFKSRLKTRLFNIAYS